MTVTSIFNDIIGPVMRGPSSSHSAASCRIGLIIRDLMAEQISSVVVDYDEYGSLASTHESHGSDMGLYGGLLGWKPDDERTLEYRRELSKRDIRTRVNYQKFNDEHPNTYRIKVENDNVCHSVKAVSTGGGMIEIREIDEASVSICGDYHELLIFTDCPETVLESIGRLPDFDRSTICKGSCSFVELKSFRPFGMPLIGQLETIPGVLHVSYLKPVLPVLSRIDQVVPFNHCQKMLEIAETEGLSLWQLALRYETQRSSLSEEQVMNMMMDLVQTMETSIAHGIAGTQYRDRILHCQSSNFKKMIDDKMLLGGSLLNTVILYVSAIMETKSSYGVIVAAPTAGSCGALPGAIIGAGHVLGRSVRDMAKAMFAASIPGIFISEHATFAGEIGGCQAECGSGSSMAAAGLAYLAGGNLQQCVAAASLALQNILGLVCDPIGNRVEAPCLGRNVMAATNAIASANMGLADYDPIVTFDEVVTAMHEVGTSIKHELRCTALGGLSIADTSKKLEARLSQPDGVKSK